MSSFIGHSLAALSTYSLEKPPLSTYFRKSWLLWLIIIASAPDIDHLVPFLHLTSYSHPPIRITHSILVSLLLPFGTIILLSTLGYKGRSLRQRSQQAILAGLSHLMLDLLTGVNQLPLLWPFSFELFKLPFGILPSAGKLNFLNYFLYRNLLIEMGVLVPFFYGIYLTKLHTIATRPKRFLGSGLLLISICFMIWSLSLSR